VLRDRLVSGQTTLSRMWLLSVVAVVLGLVGGGAAVGLFTLISLMTHLTLLGDVGFSLPSLRGYHPTPWLIVYAVAGGLIVSLFAAWAPVIRGHGIPESMEAILERDSRIRPRAAIAKPLSAAVTIGTGGPFGAEGPIIVTGGSVGSLLGQLLSVSPAERKIMLATGAAAGMSATFNTPIAAVILAIELVLFERSLRVIVPLCIASGVAAAIHVVAFGSEPLFMVATKLHVSLAHLPLYVVVGLASGVMAIVLNKGLFAMEAAFRRLPINIFWWPAIGALGFALIGLAVPRTLSMGYSVIVDTLAGRFTAGMLAVLLVAKLLSWLIALGSQTSGGTLAPMFLVGATMGALLGDAVNAVFPGWHVSPAAFALVAMGATFGAATKAVFAAVVFAAEVTGEYTMLIPLMIGAGFAELVVEAVLSDRMMTEKLSHRGFRVEFRTAVDALRTRVARQVMRGPEWVRSDADLQRARNMLAHLGIDTIAVADVDGRYLGTVTSAALDHVAASANQAASPPGAGIVAGDLASGSLDPVRPDEYLAESLERFLAHPVDALPVVQDGRVVGLLTQSDLMAERYRRSTGQELRQAGWVASLHRIVPRPSRGETPKTRPAESAGHTAPSALPKASSTPVAVDAAGDPRSAPQPAPAAFGLHRARHATPHRLLPVPADITPGLGQFVLSERSRIVVDWGSAQARPIADALAQQLRPATGFRLSVSDGRAYRDDISLSLAPIDDLPPAGWDEGYVLCSGVSGVSLTAPSLRGLNHGIQTIRQLLPVWITADHRMPGPWTMPAVTIIDYPRLAERTVRIDLTCRDTSSRDIPSRDIPNRDIPLGVFRTIVDRISDYKINRVSLQLPDGVCEPPADIVEYAAARFITVVVEPGVPAGAGRSADSGSADDASRIVDASGALSGALLVAAERAWSHASTAVPGQDSGTFDRRAAAQGPRLALTGTPLRLTVDAPWRLDLVAMPARAHRRQVSWALGTLVAPGFAGEHLRVVIDWGDGVATRGALTAGVAVDGRPAPWYTVTGEHRYARRGTYRVALLATGPDAVPARASVVIHAGSVAGSHPRRTPRSSLDPLMTIHDGAPQGAGTRRSEPTMADPAVD